VNVAVLGAAGQLGRALLPRLPGQVTPLTREQADLTRPETVRAALQALRADVVVNCAAYNFVDRAESEPEAAFAVNAWGVRELALACRDTGCLLVHFSTDYVFGLDEGRTTPYREDDAPGPVGNYGLSKLAGEYLVRAHGPRHLVIRTCGLYGVRGPGGKGGNFVETMLRLAAEGRSIPVVADQVCTPSYAVDVAEATVGLLRVGAEGLFHLTNGGSCSWHEFAAAIFELAGVKARLTATTARELGRPARRPAYSVLAGGAAERAGVPRPRPWRTALAAFLEERRQR
jgi:dTDP-4-dehydrorhamnose reductase